jgi:hypothetical protein
MLFLFLFRSPAAKIPQTPLTLETDAAGGSRTVLLMKG